MSYRRHFLRMLPPETQLPLLIEAMQPGDVLRINPACRARQLRRNALASLPRASGIPTLKSKHRIWMGDAIFRTLNRVSICGGRPTHTTGVV